MPQLVGGGIPDCSSDLLLIPADPYLWIEGCPCREMLLGGVSPALPDPAGWDPSVCWLRRQRRMEVFFLGLAQAAYWPPVEASSFLPLAGWGHPAQHQVARMVQLQRKVPWGRLRDWARCPSGAQGGLNWVQKLAVWGLGGRVEILSRACLPFEHPRI